MALSAYDPYFTALHDFVEPITSPTVEQIRSLCPHLSENLIHAMLTEIEHPLVHSFAIALPPLKIRHSFRIAQWIPGDRLLDSHPVFHPTRLCCRTAQSFADVAHWADRRNLVDAHFAFEAMAYAEKNWTELLTISNWSYAQTLYLVDPQRLDSENWFAPGKGVCEAVVTVGLTDRWTRPKVWDLKQEDIGKTDVEIWDQAIGIATTDHVLAAEIESGQHNLISYSCSRCGGGLVADHCTGCGITYPTGYVWTSNKVPLPPTIVALLREQGHEFEQEPERLYV